MSTYIITLTDEGDTVDLQLRPFPDPDNLTPAGMLALNMVAQVTTEHESQITKIEMEPSHACAS